MANKPAPKNWNDVQLTIAAGSMALTLTLWNLFAGPDRAEVVALLLGHGADADQRGANDWTPLHRAACQGTAPLDIIALLIDSGADRTVRTRIDDFATPEEEARHLGHVKAADFLRDYRGTRR